jgi:hypothetical protein
MKNYIMKDYDPYWNFILRLYHIGKIERCDFHTEMGKYFGYPMCCVKHFTDYVEIGVNFVGLYMNTMYKYDAVDVVGYVRCLKCRRNNIRKRINEYGN